MRKLPQFRFGDCQPSPLSSTPPIRRWQIAPFLWSLRRTSKRRYSIARCGLATGERAHPQGAALAIGTGLGGVSKHCIPRPTPGLGPGCRCDWLSPIRGHLIAPVTHEEMKTRRQDERIRCDHRFLSVPTKPLELTLLLCLRSGKANTRCLLLPGKGQ